MAAFGKHPTKGAYYDWVDNVGPWNVPVDRLPPSESMESLLARIDGVMARFDYRPLTKPGLEANSPVKMSRFDHVAWQEIARTSVSVSASDAARITKAMVSAV